MSMDSRRQAIHDMMKRNSGFLGLRHFNLLNKMRCGDTGIMYLAELVGTNLRYAIKVMDNEFLEGRKKMARAHTEREILRILDHPFLPTLYAHFVSDNLSCLVMDYCPGGDLHVLRHELVSLLPSALSHSPIYVILTDSPTLASEDMIHSKEVDMVCLGPDAWIDILEIHDASSLRSLVSSSFEIRTIGGSLTKLRLDNVHMDDAFSNMIESNFPFLVELTLEIQSSSGEILDITSLTLRRLMLIFSPDEEVKVQVYAPNLLTYTHLSSTVPILLFTTTPPEQDESFFLKLREALKLSSKFNIQMSGFRFGVSDLFNVDDVKTIVSHPATNVEQLL
ncbi:serine/threonine-protein kinase KIPK1-like protein [Tanacetum coccineum]